MPTIKITVQGLRDARDEARLRDALAAEAGVLYAVADHRDGCAEIEYEDDELSLDRVLEIVRAAGYQPRLAG